MNKYAKGQILYLRVRVVDSAPFEPVGRVVVMAITKDGEPADGSWLVVSEESMTTPQAVRNAVLGREPNE